MPSKDSELGFGHWPHFTHLPQPPSTFPERLTGTAQPTPEETELLGKLK